jgi:hypothetical protein
MSTLLLSDLVGGKVFTQPIKVKRNVAIAHIRPHIFVNGPLPEGSFTCRARVGDTIIGQAVVQFSDINASMNEDYFHGFVRFDFPNLSLRVGVEVELDFFTTSLAADSKWLGICRDWDLRLYDRYGATVEGAALNSCIEAAGLNLHSYEGI